MTMPREDATPTPAPADARLSRRQAALSLLASGVALGLAGCGKPEEEILPYARMPERLVPGVPLRFATTLSLGGYGRGALVTSFEGRPTKIEGNPKHPASLGATDVFAEAEVLQLYDPDRSRTVREAGRIAPWEAFVAALLPRLAALEARGGEGLRILTGPVTSPTLLRLLAAVRARFPAMRWHAHDPIGEANAHEGARLAFSRPLAALPRLDRAEVVLALDADPLGPGPQQIRLGRDFAQRRQARREATGRPFLRLYAAEPVMSLTGANADHRMTLDPGAVREFGIAVAAALGATGLPEPALPAAERAFAGAAAADLAAHRGAALVLVGEWQPPELHALAHWLNARLGAPVDVIEPIGPRPGEEAASLGELVGDLAAQRVDTLLVAGANPAYDAPADLGFAEALRRAAPLALHLGPWFDETAALCRWHLPESHALEDWADLRAPDGTASIAQPLIRPLYATRSCASLLGMLTGRLDLSAYAAVRETWAAGRPPEEFEAWWRHALHDGVVPDSAAPRVTPPAPRLPAMGPPLAGAAPDRMTLVLRPDPCVWDGRYANNAWLQECPRPMTRQVWGNAALMAPAEAAARGLADGDLVRLSFDRTGAVEAPVLTQAGLAAGVVALTLGYGRRRAGAIGDGVGTDAYRLRTGTVPWHAPGLILERTGRRREPVIAQIHQRLEGADRELLPVMPIDEFLRRAAQEPSRPPAPPPSLYPPRVKGAEDSPYAWAMVIDTTLCIGCNACVLACQAENNVPVVGPEEIARGRTMHWLRIDTYTLDGAVPEDPRPGFQPVPCMHCEQAPCEPVCPVAASVHDSEGLNVQVYNRCIGTRFCEANCPYKVRRFNFFGYGNGQGHANQDAPSLTAQRNPEVSVRARGVMEKCTYCVQRISAARREAEKTDRPIAEGEVVTACQAACPTGAILFGDLRRPDSAVSILRQEPQHYALLGNLGTRPRTTYLARVRNPNPALKGEEG